MPNFGSERSDALVGTSGKEKVSAAFYHPHQHLLYQAVVRIDQDVISLEAIEVKDELNDFKFSSPQQGVTKIEPESGDFWWVTSAGRNAKKPHSCLRSSTRPSAKQGDSSAMKSRISCAFTVSFGKNRQMLRTSLPRCVIALGWSLHSCPAMPLRQTVHTSRAGIGQLARGTFHGVGQRCVCPSSMNQRSRCNFRLSR